MSTRAICIAAMIATTGLIAQDTAEPGTPRKAPQEKGSQKEGMKNPKTEHHALLKRWVGNWKVTGKMDAMPGVPGMEKSTESTGTDSASLICDGLWLKWESAMTCNSKLSTGLWLVGYDPIQKHFISYVASSDENYQGLMPMKGQYDRQTDTWTWTCETPQGTMKSICKFDGPGKMTETLYVVGPDGKEKQFMVMHRQRTKATGSTSLVNASLTEKSKIFASKHHAVLLQDVGKWDATVEMVFQGNATKDKATERVAAICDGRWTWSEFKGQYMDMPFVGHSLVGYDSTKKQYVTLWIDSMTATSTVTRGTFDEKTKTYSLSGTCIGMDGKPTKVEQTLTCKDKNTRVFAMKMPAMKSTMTITYSRRTQNQ